MTKITKRVLLINPKPYYLREVAANEPLNLLSLAGILQQDKEVEVMIIDGAVTRVTKALLKRVIKDKRITHVGLTATTAQYPEALKALGWCRKIERELKQGVIMILGGVHASIIGEKALADGWDTVGTLEFDLKILPTIKKSLKGLIVGDQVEAKALDRLPFPARELLDPYAYHRKGYQPTVTVIGIRGCPYQCLFCDKTIMGHRPRMRSPEHLVKELKMVKKNWGIKNVVFYDDTFTLFPDRVLKLCKLIEPLKLRWECNSRVNTISAQMLKAMKKAGCYRVKFGLESANERVLKSIRKRITLTQARKAIELTKAAGIEAGVYTMFGFPEDDWDSAKDLVKFIKQTKPNRVQLALTVPLPNTDLFTQVVEELNHQPPTNLDEYYYVGFKGPHTWVKRTNHLNEREFKKASDWLQGEIGKWQRENELGQKASTNIFDDKFKRLD